MADGLLLPFRYDLHIRDASEPENEHDRLTLKFDLDNEHAEKHGNSGTYIDTMFRYVKAAEKIRNKFRGLSESSTPEQSAVVESAIVSSPVPESVQSATLEQLTADGPTNKPNERLSSDEVGKRVYTAINKVIKIPELSTSDLEKLVGLPSKTLSKSPYKQRIDKARETGVKEKESAVAVSDEESDSKIGRKSKPRDFGESVRIAKQRESKRDDLFDRQGTAKEP